jgi:hypothetical protein
VLKLVLVTRCCWSGLEHGAMTGDTMFAYVLFVVAGVAITTTSADLIHTGVYPEADTIYGKIKGNRLLDEATGLLLHLFNLRRSRSLNLLLILFQTLWRIQECDFSV